MIHLLIKNEKFKEIENLVFTSIFYSMKFSINHKFVTHLMILSWDKEIVLRFLDLKNCFKQKLEFAEELILFIDSMFRKDNLGLWYWIRVTFLSFLVNIDMRFKDERE